MTKRYNFNYSKKLRRSKTKSQKDRVYDKVRDIIRNSNSVEEVKVNFDLNQISYCKNSDISFLTYLNNALAYRQTSDDPLLNIKYVKDYIYKNIDTIVSRKWVVGMIVDCAVTNSRAIGICGHLVETYIRKHRAEFLRFGNSLEQLIKNHDQDN